MNWGDHMNFKKSFTLKSIELHEKRVIRDVIHDYIHIDHLLIWNLINTKEMQRLRRIKQLGSTSLVFQGAEHSRFVHSLGVYQVICYMLETDCLKNYLSDYDKLCVMCAGLLHDIGHGPFSHAFESLFDINHEHMSIRIILEESEVHTLLSSFHKDLPRDVASIIDHTHPNKVLVSMVSSQLDADRMDYLLRDSYMSGVTYGHFDMSRILRTMRIYDDKLVYKISGVQAIENYILARYHMYWQVYLHSTSRSYEHVLSCLFKRIKDLYKDHYCFKTDMKYLIPFLDNNVSVYDYIQLDETIMYYYFKELNNEDDSILRDLSMRLLNRKLFKYVSYKEDTYLDKVRQLLINKGYEPIYYMKYDELTKIPYMHYGPSGDLEEIQIIDIDHTIYSLPQVSEIVSALVKSNKYKYDKKVFFVKEIKDEL